MIRVVCIDVDGTLVGASGTVPAAVWPAAQKLREAGIRLALASGRPAFGIAREHAVDLDPEGWHVFQNGASLVHFASGQSRSATIAGSTITALIAQARARGRDLELYDDYGYAIESESLRARQHAELLGVPFVTRPLESLTTPAVRAQWLLAHDQVEAARAEAPAELEFVPAGAIGMPDTTFVSMTATGIGKASAVRTLAEIYGISLDELMFVGDGLNDVEAMKVVGVPVAMGNAEPEVKEVARHHVGHVDAGGLVDALQLALPR